TLGGTSACGEADPIDDDATAFLSIQGAREVALPAGEATTLVVRYHDGDDEPLAGEIAFRVLGDGGALAAPAARATDDGLARIEVRTDAVGASFRVRASAPLADPVEWSVVTRP